MELPRLALKSPSSCIRLLNAGLTDVTITPVYCPHFIREKGHIFLKGVLEVGDKNGLETWAAEGHRQGVAMSLCICWDTSTSCLSQGWQWDSLGVRMCEPRVILPAWACPRVWGWGSSFFELAHHPLLW